MLDQKSCVPCKGGMPALSKSDAEGFLSQVSDWELMDDASKIQRKYIFKNFVDALAFTNKIGEICEAENHHPDITLGWGYCVIVFYTHKINGLHENDFIMAAKASKLFQV